MIPAALANAFYSRDVPFVPTSPVRDYQGGSNVIAVDFTRTHAPGGDPRRREAAQNLDWQTIATERLSALKRFPDGWDGNGSHAISDTALTKADRILHFAFTDMTSVAPPVAVPCADGSLQLEWWLTDSRFELSIEPTGDMEGWALDRTNGHEVAADGIAAIELLSKWSGRLTADKLAHLD